MTSSVSNIKTLCEEFLNNSNSEEQLNKSLNKFLKYYFLKIVYLKFLIKLKKIYLFIFLIED